MTAGHATLLARYFDAPRVFGDDRDARRQLAAHETWGELPLRHYHTCTHPDLVAEGARAREFLDLRRYLLAKIAGRIGEAEALRVDDELRVVCGSWDGEAGERWIAALRREADRG